MRNIRLFRQTRDDTILREGRRIVIRVQRNQRSAVTVVAAGEMRVGIAGSDVQVDVVAVAVGDGEYAGGGVIGVARRRRRAVSDRPQIDLVGQTEIMDMTGEAIA